LDQRARERVILTAGRDDAISTAVAGERAASQDKAHAVSGDGDRRAGAGQVAGEDVGAGRYGSERAALD
jgi:hypothetical protein